LHIVKNSDEVLKLLAYFGVGKISELPNYEETRAQIEAIFTERDSLAKKEPVAESSDSDTL
jgi:hypothetical protein